MIEKNKILSFIYNDDEIKNYILACIYLKENNFEFKEQYNDKDPSVILNIMSDKFEIICKNYFGPIYDYNSHCRYAPGTIIEFNIDDINKHILELFLDKFKCACLEFLNKFTQKLIFNIDIIIPEDDYSCLRLMIDKLN